MMLLLGARYRIAAGGLGGEGPIYAGHAGAVWALALRAAMVETWGFFFDHVQNFSRGFLGLYITSQGKCCKCYT